MAAWRLTGSYFEACNCEAICPCRRGGGVLQGDTTEVGGRQRARSTYDTCDFALSWRIVDGHAGDLDLTGYSVVMAGSYSDDEPGSPWRVALYVDEDAPPQKRDALADIFLGRAGGTSFENFAAMIEEVYAIRSARIELKHARGRERIRAGTHVTVVATEVVDSDLPVSCGIPGHDHPGEELITELQRVDDGPLRWEVTGRCGFATDFEYRSDD